VKRDPNVSSSLPKTSPMLSNISPIARARELDTKEKGVRLERNGKRGQGVTYKPHALMVFNIIIILIGEAEVMREDTVLVIDDFGVCALPADVVPGLDLEPFVLRHGYVGGHVLAVADPDDDMLPVVLVPDAARAVDGLVLLEVVAVEVRAPAVVAPLARVHVIVVQVRLVAAVPVLGPAAVQTLGQVPLRVDGRAVVAPVCVEVHCCLKRSK